MKSFRTPAVFLLTAIAAALGGPPATSTTGPADAAGRTARATRPATRPATGAAADPEVAEFLDRVARTSPNGNEYDDNGNVVGLVLRRGFAATTRGDADLAVLARLTAVRHLDLYAGKGETPYTPAGLAHLSELKGLRRLRLTCSIRIDDALLAAVAPLDGLEELDLEFVAVGDSDLVHVGRLTGLRKLDLWQTEVTDAGVIHLAGLTRLEDLRLPRRVTDAGLARVAGMGRLERLNLSATAVTPAGLRHLHDLPHLKKLDLPWKWKDAAPGSPALGALLARRPDLEVRYE
jgi:hypothetical protein